MPAPVWQARVAPLLLKNGPSTLAELGDALGLSSRERSTMGTCLTETARRPPGGRPPPWVRRAQPEGKPWHYYLPSQAEEMAARMAGAHKSLNTTEEWFSELGVRICIIRRLPSTLHVHDFHFRFCRQTFRRQGGAQPSPKGAHRHYASASKSECGCAA
jgi:hypothetical protein